MRKLALSMLVVLAAACSGGGEAGGEARPAAVTTTAAATAAPAKKLPKPADLPCFKCHELAAYENGKFPHAKSAHQDAGHCSVCHAGLGHHGVPINRAACLECHDDSELVDVLGEAPAPADGHGDGAAEEAPADDAGE